MTEFQDVRAVILAGGSGTRLWPLSRLHAPKQFLRVTSQESLLEATISRLGPMISPSQVLIVTGKDLAKGEGYHLLERFEKILEPVGRNTAPAIGIAALKYRLHGLDPIMVVLPADHLIRDVPAFHEALRTAIDAARANKLVTFGITPTEPATGYGYIKTRTGIGNVLPVEEFKEKPDRATAERFLTEGSYYWNSGMFVWKSSVILAEIARMAPSLSSFLDSIEAHCDSAADLDRIIDLEFSRAPSLSIDYGVLEKNENLHLVPAQIGWSDVGSWDAIYEVAEKDSGGNAFQGNVLAIDCRGSFVRSEQRLVAAVGLDEVMVIETPDAVLVARRGHAQGVRGVVDELVRRSASEHVDHLMVRRPWGSYTVLEQGPGFKIKRIEVNPGGRLSLQSHAHRSEHWIVLEGTARVTCGDKIQNLERNQSTYVAIGEHHRLENPGSIVLKIIEVQVGERVDEDDITRYDDQYGR